MAEQQPLIQFTTNQVWQNKHHECVGDCRAAV